MGLWGQNLRSMAPVNARAALAGHVPDNTGRLGDASIDPHTQPKSNPSR